MSSSFDYTWWHVKSVLENLGWRQIPNHTDGILTFNNDKGQMITVERADHMNEDYFDFLLEYLEIERTEFDRLAKGVIASP